MLWDAAASSCHKRHLNWRCDTPQQLRSDGDVTVGSVFCFLFVVYLTTLSVAQNI